MLHSADVLVVGGGTSGAPAAIAAGAQSMQGLGGTGTYGGIHTYWYGRRVGFAARVMQMVDTVHDSLRRERLSGPLPQWNIEAKIHALMQGCVDAGVKMALNVFVVGTLVEGDAVRSGVIATRSGPAAVVSRMMVDASGDADVAAYAGADCVYGAERDHNMIYSWGQ